MGKPNYVSKRATVTHSPGARMRNGPSDDNLCTLFIGQGDTVEVTVEEEDSEFVFVRHTHVDVGWVRRDHLQVEEEAHGSSD